MSRIASFFSALQEAFAARPAVDGPKPSSAKPAKAGKLEWPNTTPIDKTDPYWEFNNNMNCNGINYMKAEVSPGRWQWVVNEEAERRRHEMEKHRRDLYWALRSRALSDEEMAEVERYGDHLNIEPMVPYRPEEKKRELNDALLTQFKMRLAAETK